MYQTCLECGKPVKNLTRHMQNVHGFFSKKAKATVSSLDIEKVTLYTNSVFVT